MESVAARGSGNITQKFGQVGLQAQDIAVQMQSGTKAATIFMQQGTQIASIFGPKAAIIAGIVAIGAAIWNVASGMKEAAKQAESFKKVVEANRTVASAEDDADVAEARVKHGDAYAEALKRQLVYEQRIADINAAVRRGEMNQGQADALKSAEKRSHEAANELVTIKQQSEVYKEINSNASAAAKAQAELSDMALTDMQRMMKLASEIGGLSSAAFGGAGTSQQQQAAQTQIAEKQVELAKLATQMSAEAQQQEKQASDEAEAAQKKRIQGFDKINQLLEEQQEKQKQLAGLEKQLSSAQAKAVRQADYAKGQTTVDKANNILLSPQERADARQEAKREKNAIQRAAAREVEETDKIKDSEGRVIGRRGLTREDRDKAIKGRVDRADRAKNKEKIEATFADDQIQKIVDKIKEAFPR